MDCAKSFSFLPMFVTIHVLKDANNKVIWIMPFKEGVHLLYVPVEVLMIARKHQLVRSFSIFRHSFAYKVVSEIMMR